ncbi:MAG: LacI family DNA-binding transcriptional regulator [Phycisphaeraceae bacterium]
MSRITSKPLRPNRVTIKDVAAASGVSISTVSKVMNRPLNLLDISEAARKRVLEAAGRLGYRASWRARAFVSGRTHMVALIHPHNLPLISNDLWADAFRTLSDGLSERGYDPQFVSGGDAHIQRCRQMLLDQRFDGVVILNQLRPEVEYALEQAGLPAVLVNAEPREGHACVIPDDRQGGRDLTRHLLSLGHRRVVFNCVSQGVRKHFSYEARLTGINDALAEAGLPAALCVVNPDRQETVTQVLAAQPRPTAIIEYHSSGVLELLRACWKCGLSVPGQLSIATFNDTPITRNTVPSMTTVGVPSVEMAGVALEILSVGLESGQPLAPQRVVMPETLIVRESTVPPQER